MKNTYNNPICIIPARSGSKGLINKNILFLSEKPLIFHTIDAVINSGIFRREDIYVSTDSLEYKKIIEKERKIKVLIRKEELASDSATTYDMLIDFLSNFNGDINFMLCQPTSPLRTDINIIEAYDKFINNDCDNVVSFCKADKSLKLFSSIDKYGVPRNIIGIDKGYRRQEEEEKYYPNGAIFISSKNKYIQNKSFFTEKTIAYIMNKYDSIDIDDKYDFVNAIGNIYFNYRIREEKNKTFYRDEYEKKSRHDLLDKIIIGDSRMREIELNKFFNISIDGVTANSVLENIDYILSNKKINEVFISLGINDLIAGYGVEKTNRALEKLILKFINKNIKITISKIIYTIYRYEVKNDHIEKVNNFLEEISRNKNIKIIDPNSIISTNNKLDFKYTLDGLHMNKIGNELLREYYKMNLN